MSGLENYQIRRTENFERTLQKQFRERYRKNSAGLKEFIELISKFVNDLSIDPRPRPPLGHLEPFPKGSSRSGWELWKLEFKMPQIPRGEAGQGRLIYLLNTAKKQVSLVWIYTHTQFKKRPPDEALKNLLMFIIDPVELDDERDGTDTQETGPTEEETGPNDPD